MKHLAASLQECFAVFCFGLINAQIKLCLPILFYGVEACPTNSSVRQSFEFTMNKILFKVFGATSRYIYECFGIDNANLYSLITW